MDRTRTGASPPTVTTLLPQTVCLARTARQGAAMAMGASVDSFTSPRNGPRCHARRPSDPWAGHASMTFGGVGPCQSPPATADCPRPSSSRPQPMPLQQHAPTGIAKPAPRIPCARDDQSALHSSGSHGSGRPCATGVLSAGCDTATVRRGACRLGKLAPPSVVFAPPRRLAPAGCRRHGQRGLVLTGPSPPSGRKATANAPSSKATTARHPWRVTWAA